VPAAATVSTPRHASFERTGFPQIPMRLSAQTALSPLALAPSLRGNPVPGREGKRANKEAKPAKHEQIKPRLSLPACDVATLIASGDELRRSEGLQPGALPEALGGEESRGGSRINDKRLTNHGDQNGSDDTDLPGGQVALHGGSP
jgi:hypothetical protein